MAFFSAEKITWYQPMRGQKNTSETARASGSISARLAELRLLFEKSQYEIAKDAQISRTRWVSYEYGRSPLPADVGLTLCRNLNVSEGWLATGRGYYRPSLCKGRAYAVLLTSINPGETFESAFNRLLSPNNQLYEIFSGIAQLDWKGFTEGRDTIEARRFLRFLAACLTRQIPDEHIEDFTAKMLRMSWEYIKKNGLSVSLFDVSNDRHTDAINSFLKFEALCDTLPPKTSKS